MYVSLCLRGARTAPAGAFDPSDTSWFRAEIEGDELAGMDNRVD